MKLNRRNGTIAFISFLVVVIILSIWWNELGALFSHGSYKDLDRMVETMMDKSATPGVAIVTSKQGEIEYKSYGYADVKNNIKVNEESLFELGSTTKAFTALAILLLEEDGHINGSDSITDYISWFTPTYQGEQVSITIDQLLSHTSGIPSWSISLIPEGTASDLLEKTVHNIATIPLNTSPGAKYHYATINYDVLALIIEKVTGETYQKFVTDNILRPIGMNDSYFSTGTEDVFLLTKGYKYYFGKSIEYDAPRYYGNMAAGYLVTSVKELSCWINAQLGRGDIPNKLRNAILKSHEVDQTTAGYVASNTYYSYGWSNEITGEVINHSGANPNYSSQVIIDLKKQEAVFVLANVNSTVATQIASNIYNDMNGMNISKYSYDDYFKVMDYIFSILSFITSVMLCVKIFKFTANRKKQNSKLEARESEKIGRNMIGLILRIIFMVLLMIWPYLLNYNYYYIRVWMSNAILVWGVLSAFCCALSVIAKTIRIIEIRRRGGDL